MKYYVRFFLVLLILPSLILLNQSDALAAVTLQSFTYTIKPGQITLYWVTASELNNAGFFINRLGINGLYNRISDFIPSRGDGFTGASYEFVDQDVVNGSTYYYKLEMVDTNTQSHFEGPLTVALVTPTPTLTRTSVITVTATNTQTRVPSPTSTSPGLTATPSRTPTATGSRTPVPSATSTSYPIVTYTPRPSITPTPQPSGTVTPIGLGTPTTTTTLIPLPSITLIFPAFTQTETPTITVTFTSSTPTLTRTNTPSDQGRTAYKIIYLVGIVILLWLLLGGFIYFFMRRSGS
jgi:hypothetical protein